MKRVTLFLVASIICSAAYCQDRYVYNGAGKLNYVVSDTLKQLIIGDVVVESTKTMVGSHVQYCTSKTYIITNGEFKHLITKHQPYIF